MDGDVVGALGGFLAWGPIGLAGLMLTLVVVALSMGKLTAGRERLLRTFLYVGAACFLAALAAQFFARQEEHVVTLSILPNDLDGSTFEPPRIRLNGQTHDRATEMTITGPSALQIDVSRAVGLFSRAVATAERAEAEAGTLRQEAEVAKAAAQRLDADLSASRASLAAAEAEASERGEAIAAAITTVDQLQRQVATLEQAQAPELAAPVVVAPVPGIRRTLPREAPDAIARGVSTRRTIREVDREVRRLNESLREAVR